ncbi:unnamed protein product [Amoebophrya sp. A25]|nr:unnamed protein product [Amoebophrya sp. A25]|eukprot:GSA25T00012730001.1
MVCVNSPPSGGGLLRRGSWLGRGSAGGSPSKILERLQKEQPAEEKTAALLTLAFDLHQVPDDQTSGGSSSSHVLKMVQPRGSSLDLGSHLQSGGAGMSSMSGASGSTTGGAFSAFLGSAGSSFDGGVVTNTGGSNRKGSSSATGMSWSMLDEISDRRTPSFSSSGAFGALTKLLQFLSRCKKDNAQRLELQRARGGDVFVAIAADRFVSLLHEVAFFQRIGNFEKNFFSALPDKLCARSDNLIAEPDAVMGLRWDVVECILNLVFAVPMNPEVSQVREAAVRDFLPCLCAKVRRCCDMLLAGHKSGSSGNRTRADHGGAGGHKGGDKVSRALEDASDRVLRMLRVVRLFPTLELDDAPKERVRILARELWPSLRDVLGQKIEEGRAQLACPGGLSKRRLERKESSGPDVDLSNYSGIAMGDASSMNPSSATPCFGGVAFGGGDQMNNNSSGQLQQLTPTNSTPGFSPSSSSSSGGAGSSLSQRLKRAGTQTQKLFLLVEHRCGCRLWDVVTEVLQLGLTALPPSTERRALAVDFVSLCQVPLRLHVAESDALEQEVYRDFARGAGYGGTNRGGAQLHGSKLLYGGANTDVGVGHGDPTKRGRPLRRNQKVVLSPERSNLRDSYVGACYWRHGNASLMRALGFLDYGGLTYGGLVADSCLAAEEDEEGSFGGNEGASFNHFEGTTSGSLSSSSSSQPRPECLSDFVSGDALREFVGSSSPTDETDDRLFDLLGIVRAPVVNKMKSSSSSSSVATTLGAAASSYPPATPAAAAAPETPRRGGNRGTVSQSEDGILGHGEAVTPARQAGKSSTPFAVRAVTSNWTPIKGGNVCADAGDGIGGRGGASRSSQAFASRIMGRSSLTSASLSRPGGGASLQALRSQLVAGRTPARPQQNKNAPSSRLGRVYQHLLPSSEFVELLRQCCLILADVAQSVTDSLDSADAAFSNARIRICPAPTGTTTSVESPLDPSTSASNLASISGVCRQPVHRQSCNRRSSIGGGSAVAVAGGNLAAMDGTSSSTTTIGGYSSSISTSNDVDPVAVLKRELFGGGDSSGGCTTPIFGTPSPCLNKNSLALLGSLLDILRADDAIAKFHAEWNPRLSGSALLSGPAVSQPVVAVLEALAAAASTSEDCDALMRTCGVVPGVLGKCIRSGDSSAIAAVLSRIAVAPAGAAGFFADTRRLDTHGYLFCTNTEGNGSSPNSSSSKIGAAGVAGSSMIHSSVPGVDQSDYLLQIMTAGRNEQFGGAVSSTGGGNYPGIGSCSSFFGANQLYPTENMDETAAMPPPPPRAAILRSLSTSSTRNQHGTRNSVGAGSSLSLGVSTTSSFGGSPLVCWADWLLTLSSDSYSPTIGVLLQAVANPVQRDPFRFDTWIADSGFVARLTGWIKSQRLTLQLQGDVGDRWRNLYWMLASASACLEVSTDHPALLTELQCLLARLSRPQGKKKTLRRQHAILVSTGASSCSEHDPNNPGTASRWLAKAQTLGHMQRREHEMSLNDDMTRSSRPLAGLAGRDRRVDLTSGPGSELWSNASVSSTSSDVGSEGSTTAGANSLMTVEQGNSAMNGAGGAVSDITGVPQSADQGTVTSMLEQLVRKYAPEEGAGYRPKMARAISCRPTPYM